MAQQQDFKHHARVVPIFHVWTLLPLTANLGWSLYRLARGASAEGLVQLIVALVLIVGFVSLRVQVLSVQDRVIRLEMRLRLANVLPASMQASIAQLTPKQLVALRFASDAELPSLVERVLSGQLATQKDIKAQVKEWQADYLRA